VHRYVYTLVSNLLLAFGYEIEQEFEPAEKFDSNDYLKYEIFIEHDLEMKAAKAEADRKKLLAAEELKKTTADAAANKSNDKNGAAAKKPKTKGASAGA
jgi:hypothetical protein